MLTELRVENLGIIADLRLDLGAGMTAITGETGAGKTLLVDALELLCGGRADPQIVREGAADARVEGRFTSGDDEIVLARVVPGEGRSRGYMNGRLATAGELAEAGHDLVDLHGQHAHQSLLAPVEQRALLDRWIGDAARDALTTLRKARAELHGLAAEIDALGGDEQSRAREVDLLRYQLAEISGAAIEDADESERLARECDLLADAEAHRDALGAAYVALEGSVEDGLGLAASALDGRAPFEGIAVRLRALQAEAQDVARDTRVAAEDVVVDPDRLAALQARRAALRALTRKYGPTLADVVAYGIDVSARLAQLESYDVRATELEAARRRAHAHAEKAAAALSELRRDAAAPLAAAVTARLRELAMPQATFTVDVQPGDAGEDGADLITFVLAPNPGEPPRPLARAASGGELARAMLALRLVLSEAPPTLVFDEVDAGIGGEAGAAVGRALASLGGHHQVFCVTHLAQVAAFADAHIAVEKEEREGRTVAAATVLLDDARVSEISRMLAGVGTSAHARRHAKELLRGADEVRAEAGVR